MHLFSSSLGKPRLINMEYLAIEKEAYEKLIEGVVSLKRRVNELCPGDKGALGEGWIENAELSRRLNISIRTLQTYRERGILGFSIIGRKIYYKTSDIERLIASNRISYKKTPKSRKETSWN